MRLHCLQCGHEAERKIPATDIGVWFCPNCHYIHYMKPKWFVLARYSWKQSVALSPCHWAAVWTLDTANQVCWKWRNHGGRRGVSAAKKWSGRYQSPFILLIRHSWLHANPQYLYNWAKRRRLWYWRWAFDSALFKEEDIPWDKIAFGSGVPYFKKLLWRLQAIRQPWQIPVHVRFINKTEH